MPTKALRRDGPPTSCRVSTRCWLPCGLRWPVWADTAVVVMTDATVFYPAFANIRCRVLGATLAAKVIGGG